MNRTKSFQLGVWVLTAIVVGLALFVWWPATKNLNSYSLFPIFGLIAFSLMWLHYVAGAGERYFGIKKDSLKLHFQITSYIVLLCILIHPFLFYSQLYLDGFGLPPQSIIAIYPTLIQQLAVFAGVTALICFLLFELHRFYRGRSWWKYIEWANVGAMGLILLHGFTLGGELRQPWFQVIWLLYAVTFVISVAYTMYSKPKE